MIKVQFFINGENLSGFRITGHAGYANAGRDIVCAAVSSAAYMAANTVTELADKNAAASDEDGTMLLQLSSPSEKTELILRGLEMHLKALATQYPENITVKYGGVKNA